MVLDTGNPKISSRAELPHPTNWRNMKGQSWPKGLHSPAGQNNTDKGPLLSNLVLSHTQGPSMTAWGHMADCSFQTTDASEAAHQGCWLS